MLTNFRGRYSQNLVEFHGNPCISAWSYTEGLEAFKKQLIKQCAPPATSEDPQLSTTDSSTTDITN